MLIANTSLLSVGAHLTGADGLGIARHVSRITRRGRSVRAPDHDYAYIAGNQEIRKWGVVMARAHVQTISQRPKGLMSLSSESDVAWELVECIRSRLTVAELNNAYVNLGIGEFGAVIETLITIVVRERLTVPDELIETMETWRALHHPDGPVSERLTRQLAQCRQHRDSRCGA